MFMEKLRVLPSIQAVILNGVSPRAQAGVKRSEESLTETRAQAVW